MGPADDQDARKYIAFVAGMIQLDAFDIQERLDEFAAPADLQEESELE